MDDLHEVLTELGDAAAQRNRNAASQMYDALITLRDEVFCANPNIDFMKRVITRAIPK